MPPAPPSRTAPPATDTDAVLATLDRLGDLHQRGILTDEEFAAKKAELLARL
ncbi:SHOCT domain-containing protein [Frankia sp. CNm7]|uniref:SHOCT domain-containing protein n=1 Tax=Frankia nepalensis TaxID=1836974 RepID=UPI001934512B|nr:SHOCT domain-containing protein [Frankia nepalensis]MBL7523611.1 SHOCT domain-containing protein [Frankia nepalensis]